MGPGAQLGWPPPSLQQEPGTQQLLRALLLRSIPIPAGILHIPFAPAAAREGGRAARGGFVSPSTATMCSQELRACLTAPIRFSVTLPKGSFLAVQAPPPLFTAPEDGFPFCFLLFCSPSSLITASPACPSELSHLSQQGQGNIHTPCARLSDPKEQQGDTAEVSQGQQQVGTLPLSFPSPAQRELSSHLKPSKPPDQGKLGHELPPKRGGAAQSPPQHPGHTWHTELSPRSRQSRRNWQPGLFIEQFKHY